MFDLFLPGLEHKCEHEDQFRSIINHSAPSDIRTKLGHVYKSRVVVFGVKKYSSKHHSEGRLRKHKV